MKKPKSKIDLLKEALTAKRAEQKAITEITLAKVSDRDGNWQRLMQARIKVAESVLLNLDVTGETFANEYTKFQAVRDEYLLLLSLLADPEKRAKKVENEIVELQKEFDEAQKIGETSGQY